MNKPKMSMKLLRFTILIGVLLICMPFISQVFAKYILKINGSSSAAVACFTPSFTSDKIDITGINNPGDSDTCKLKIQNYTDDKVSNVAMNYKIVINTTGNLPLIFTIMDNSNNILSICDCDGNSGNKEYVYESFRTFSPGVAQFHEYTIEIEWKENRNDAQFSGVSDAVYVSVKWEQID